MHPRIILRIDLSLGLQLRSGTEQLPLLPEVSMSTREKINLNDILRNLPHQWINAVVEHAQNIGAILITGVINDTTALHGLPLHSRRRHERQAADFKPMNARTELSRALE
jgi:hypothetical protein